MFYQCVNICDDFSDSWCNIIGLSLYIFAPLFSLVFLNRQKLIVFYAGIKNDNFP